MRHQESSPVLSTRETTQAIRNAAGKSKQVKENASWWSSKTCTLNVADKHALVIILKFKMASLLMITMMEEDVVTVDHWDISRCLRAWRCCLCLMVLKTRGIMDLRQLIFKKITLPQSVVSRKNKQTKNKKKVRNKEGESKFWLLWQLQMH